LEQAARVGVCKSAGQVTDFVFVLNNRDAIRAFSRGGNVTLGGDVSVAAGPVGRDVEANVAPKAAIYTYSLSKGLFAGVSLEGAVIVTEKGKNEHYYGRSVTASQILNGKAAAPPGSAALRNAAGR
jgi:SH3 domain-containing YSC84-like protein 1